MNEHAMNSFQPLAGIRVIDFSHVIAGPLATFYLSQMGAQVTKVENRDGGDVMRRGKGLAAFVALNAGKDSVNVDLGDEIDRQELIERVKQADVLVDSLRPGVLERFGLGAEAVRQLNPKLVYCAISGFGRSGPWAERPAYDHVIQAATGMALLAGNDGDAPIKTGFPVIDAASGILSALAILAALRERDQTGIGRIIDVSMTGAAMQLMYPMACQALTDGRSPPRVGNQGYSGSPGADMFKTSDGWIALGANTPKQFVALLKVLHQPDLANDVDLFDAPLSSSSPPTFLISKNPGRLRELLETAIQTWKGQALEDACIEALVPVARVRTIAEFANLAQANSSLHTVSLHADGIQVESPGLGFHVR